MYFLTFKPLEGDKKTAYSFVDEDTYKSIPKKFIEKKVKLKLSEVPSKEVAEYLLKELA